MLSNLTILDLSHRLPGPLAGKVLSDLGANVIKIEDQKFKDPFLSGLFNDNDDHFITWYKNLNDSKTVERFDFKSSEAKSIMSDFLKKADAIILAQPEKINKLLGTTRKEIETNHPELTVVELSAGKGQYKHLHDLNALAIAGLLDMHLDSRDEKIIRPPFLPVSGISFGHWVATKLLAGIIAKKNWVEADLEEATEKVLSPFKSKGSESPRFLHNGKFPCYCLYKTSDQKALAVAAVEDKFWTSFVELFKLNLTMEDRFDTSERVFEIIAQRISETDSTEVAKLLKNQDICVNLV